MKIISHCVSASFLLLANLTFANDLDPIKIVSWNMEWLSSDGYPQIKQSIRSSSDFEKLKGHFGLMSPDIFAFQEVDSLKVINDITGNDYQIFMSDRSTSNYKRHQFDDINQYTGFAFKNDWKINNRPDLNLNSGSGHKLRFAAYVIASPPNSPDFPIHLLSIHLKAGCIGQLKNSRSCRLLKEQGIVLNGWLENRILNQDTFIIAGDFNHNLAYPNDWFMSVLDSKLNDDVLLASRETQPNCIVKSKKSNSTFQYKSVIDHMLVSKDVSISNVEQYVFSKQTVVNHKMTDHCPIVGSFTFSN